LAGSNNTANGWYSGAFGISNQCNASYSFIAGESNIINSSGAFALGYDNSVTGYYSGALGGANIVDGAQSYALGYECSSIAAYTFAEGYNAKASGTSSIAMGSYVQATTGSSITLGSGSGTSPLVNSTANSLAVGFNSTTPAFTVTGGGSTSSTGIAGSLTVNGASNLTGGATIGTTTTTPSTLNGVFNCTNATFNGGTFTGSSTGTSTFGTLTVGGATIPTGTNSSPSYYAPLLNGAYAASPITGYNLAMNGNANFQGAVVIGATPAYFNQTTLPYGPFTGGPYSLFVAGGIITESANVAVANSQYWADFVFDKGYKLTPLAELENFITKNHHLPEIPSAEEVVKSGVNVAKMDAKLLQKIEELTLYMIDMKKENDALKERVKLLEKKN